jgi:hypothetical protein
MENIGFVYIMLESRLFKLNQHYPINGFNMILACVFSYYLC